MKTPEQIAQETFAKMHSQAAEQCENEILGLIAEAIEADRVQRDPFTGRAPLIPEGNSQLGRHRIHHLNGI